MKIFVSHVNDQQKIIAAEDFNYEIEMMTCSIDIGQLLSTDTSNVYVH